MCLQKNIISNVEQIELQAKLLNYFLGSNKSNINQDDQVNSREEIDSLANLEAIINMCQRVPHQQPWAEVGYHGLYSNEDLRDTLC